MKHLSPIAMVLSIIAMMMGAVWIGLIALDDWLFSSGRKTISERLLSLEWDGTLGIIAITTLVGLFAFTFTSLGGHLFYYQGQRNHFWLYVWAAWCVFGFIGLRFGHDFFGQPAVGPIQQQQQQK
jgi:hypothetical protein